ncbi:MAG: hypothetical protein K5891_06930 [Lachnospiraceae bacterium]|nr:hypothetical protein [Lachnospiraceae bacterium]
MMMAPETFVDMQIRGKSREDALLEVGKLWEEIRYLKHVIEEEPDSEERMIRPSPETRLSVLRDYLDTTRDYFASMVWEYDPTPEEEKDRAFNERLQEMESITVDCSGFLCGGEERTITFDWEKILADQVVKRREDFIGQLKSLHLGEWEKEYENPGVCDGIQWSVEIRFSSGKDFRSSGSNHFPFSFNAFLDLMGMSEVV